MLKLEGSHRLSYEGRKMRKRSINEKTERSSLVDSWKNAGNEDMR